VYLMAAIDCRTRDIVVRHLETRCRDREAIALIEQAAAERAIAAGTLTLGTDNGSAFTARAVKTVPERPRDRAPSQRLSRSREPGVHRALVREAQRALHLAPRVRDDREAREAIATCVIHYHQRPHSGLDYRTPLEVAATWNDGGLPHLIPAARPVNAAGEQVNP
jgi:putative transposase